MNGRMEWRAFEQYVLKSNKFAGHVRKLFEVLDEDGIGFVKARTVLRIKREYERSCDVKHLNLEDLRKRIITVHGNLTRAWRVVFDPEDTGHCCLSLFVKACKSVGFSGDLKATFRELTGGGVRHHAILIDLDPEGVQLMLRLNRELESRFTTPRDAWFAIMREHNTNGRMKQPDFESMCKNLGFTAKESRSLYNALDVGGGPMQRASMEHTRGAINFNEWNFLYVVKKLQDERVDFEQSRRHGSDASSNSSTRGNSPDGSPRLAWNDRTQKGAEAVEEEKPEFVVVLSKEDYAEVLRRRQQMTR